MGAGVARREWQKAVIRLTRVERILYAFGGMGKSVASRVAIKNLRQTTSDLTGLQKWWRRVSRCCRSPRQL